MTLQVLRASDPPGSSMHALCDPTPCEADSPLGDMQLGIGRAGFATRTADHHDFALAQNTTLALEYDDRNTLRIVGYVLLILGFACEFMDDLYLWSGPGHAGISETASWGFIVGCIVLLIPGMILTLLNDHVDVRNVGTF
jgi:hypothetical protein